MTYLQSSIIGQGGTMDQVTYELNVLRSQLRKVIGNFENELSALPEGCLLQKTVNGKTYMYRQFPHSPKDRTNGEKKKFIQSILY